MRRLFLASLCLAALLLTMPAARATWSILAVDRATGEVAVAGATCINGSNLVRFLPVIRVGVGAGVAQAEIDNGARNRQLMWKGLQQRLSPQEILDVIEHFDARFQNRQMGIVDFEGRVLTFTGSQAADWAGGVTGTVGTITYAIQGNILTGSPVVTAAESAFRESAADLATRLVKAMDAARNMGGDGRCSCSNSNPTGCGSPPPNFLKSAQVGFIQIARIGDQDGTCTGQTGCATGEYYMTLNVRGNQVNKPDPVDQLIDKFVEWRADWLGRPDHLKSEVIPRELTLLSGVQPVRTVKIVLRDWNGDRVTTPMQSIDVSAVDPGASAVLLGEPVAQGDGVYLLPVRASGPLLGRVRLKITVDDGQGPVTLYPYLEISVAPPRALIANTEQLSSSLGDDLSLSMRGGPGLANRQYLILASASGSSPGFSVGNLYIPLVFDPLVWFTFENCGTAALPGTCGVLDELGRAEAAALLEPGDLAAVVSGELTLAAIVRGDYVSEPVTVQVLP